MLFQHGKVNQIRLVTNRVGKPKGFGYIEYEQEVSETAVNYDCLVTDVIFDGKFGLPVLSCGTVCYAGFLPITFYTKYKS